MFLTDKYSSLLPPHHHHSDAAPPKPSSRRRQQQLPGKAACFDAALAARLRTLLPPGPASSSPLAALARLANLLALTLADAAQALAGKSDAAAAAAVAAHLDAGLALLDACNAITARLERLRRRRLLARFALHLLASSSSTERARAALADRDDRNSASSPPPPPLPSLPFDQPRGRRLSAAARVLVAVNAVSSLAAAAAAAVLGSGDNAALATAFFPWVSTSGGAEFPWAEPFNAVSSQLLAVSSNASSEVDAVDEAVRRLTSVLDGEGGDEAAVRAAAREVEERTEELAARLDRLSDAVNGVFRAALGLRNAELGAFMAGPAGKTCG